MPRPCPALTTPFFSRPRHSTAVERRPVGYLLAFGFFRLPRGVPRKLLSEAYQSSSQRSIPTTVKSGSSTLQKRSLKLLDWQFGYFRLPHGLSRRTWHCQSRAGTRHSMCELTLNLLTTTIVAPPSNASKWQMGFNSAFKGLTARQGRGTAWAWHGHGMLCVNRS